MTNPASVDHAHIVKKLSRYPDMVIDSSDPDPANFWKIRNEHLWDLSLMGVGSLLQDILALSKKEGFKFSQEKGPVIASLISCSYN